MEERAKRSMSWEVVGVMSGLSLGERRRIPMSAEGSGGGGGRFLSWEDESCVEGSGDSEDSAILGGCGNGTVYVSSG